MLGFFPSAVRDYLIGEDKLLDFQKNTFKGKCVFTDEIVKSFR